MCSMSLDVETSPVLMITSPPVALPVPEPPSIVMAPPATLFPIPLVPLIVELVGVSLASALPNTTVLFLIIMLLPMFIVPCTTSNGSDVTLASVLIVNDVALDVAPITGQLPSKFVTALLAILIVSPTSTPNVLGV